MPSYNDQGPGPKFKDYFGMAIPKFALDLKFEDRSWHNDAGAIMALDFKTFSGELLSLRLFFADPEDTANWMGSEYSVYLVQVDPNDESDVGHAVTFYAGNSLQTMQQIAAETLTFLRIVAAPYTDS